MKLDERAFGYYWGLGYGNLWTANLISILKCCFTEQQLMSDTVRFLIEIYVGDDSLRLSTHIC